MNVALNLALDGAVIGTGIGAILLYAVLGVLLMLLGVVGYAVAMPQMTIGKRIGDRPPNASVILISCPSTIVARIVAT